MKVIGLLAGMFAGLCVEYKLRPIGRLVEWSEFDPLSEYDPYA